MLVIYILDLGAQNGTILTVVGHEGKDWCRHLLLQTETDVHRKLFFFDVQGHVSLLIHSDFYASTSIHSHYFTIKLLSSLLLAFTIDSDVRFHRNGNVNFMSCVFSRYRVSLMLGEVRNLFGPFMIRHMSDLPQELII